MQAQHFFPLSKQFFSEKIELLILQQKSIIIFLWGSTHFKDRDQLERSSPLFWIMA